MCCIDPSNPPLKAVSECMSPDGFYNWMALVKMNPSMKTKYTLLFVLMAVSAAAQAGDDVEASDEKIATEYIKRHDRNGDGKVSIDEYMNRNSVQAKAPYLVDGARSGFAAKDLNNDGYIDLSEIKADLARHRAASRNEDPPALLIWHF